MSAVGAGSGYAARMAADHPAERRSAETDAVSGPPVSRPPASGTATAFVDPDATVKPPRDAPPSASGSVGRIDPIGSTAPDEAGARPPPSVARFPVRDWDRYKPERLLGQGGMGTVFLAWDVRLQRHVALKFVRSDSPQHTARLLVEARAQARVHHERVCQVYEVGEVQDQVYIAMQFVDGQPLGVAARSLSFEQRAMVIRDAALGLHEAHRAGIVHRDVKPSNIMIERAEDGQIRTYVMDFGLARDHKDTDAETGTVMGTPAYMSPEQARGEVGRLDRRADVYSLGATLYQVLCGQPPIPGANGLELLHNIASTEPRPPEAID
ncbi:MAG: serine/threonine-protein kinase, partial [Polyangiaceae bacterium]